MFLLHSIYHFPGGEAADMCVHISRIQSSQVCLCLCSRWDRKGYCLVRSDPPGCQRVCAGMRGHWPQMSVRALRVCVHAACLWAALGIYISDAYPEYSLLSVEEISDPRSSLSQLCDLDAKRMLTGKKTGDSHKPSMPKVKVVWPQLQKCCTVSRWFSQQTVCGPPRIDSASNQK